MSEYKCDIGVRVTAESSEEAAQMCAAILAIAMDASSGAVRPAFVGVRAAEPSSAPEPKPAQDQVPEVARGIFDGIMGESPSA